MEIRLVKIHFRKKLFSSIFFLILETLFIFLAFQIKKEIMVGFKRLQTVHPDGRVVKEFHSPSQRPGFKPESL